MSVRKDMGRSEVFDLTLSLDTNAYADGDVLAATQEITGFFPSSDSAVTLDSVFALDEDDQGIAFDLVFLNANTAIGTENSAPNISDANAQTIIGRIRVAADDYIDLGGSRIANLIDIRLPLKSSSTSNSLWVGAITRGAPTHTASGIRLKFGVRY